MKEVDIRYFGFAKVYHGLPEEHLLPMKDSPLVARDIKVQLESKVWQLLQLQLSIEFYRGQRDMDTWLNI